MRRMWSFPGIGALILALSSIAAAQIPSQKTAPASTQSADRVASNQQSSQTDSFPQPEQPMSLGDLARLVRAKKNSQPKAAKIFDDDNMPRALYRGDKAPEFGGSSGSSSGSWPEARPVGFLGHLVRILPESSARSEKAAIGLWEQPTRSGQRQRGRR